MTTNRIGIVLVAAALLGACAGSRVAPGRAALDPLQARGEAPGWRLTVTPVRIVFATDDGAIFVDEPNTTGSIPRSGRLAGQRIAVETALTPCALTSGTFAQTVRVTVDGTVRSGCGGEASRELSLGAGNWTVLAVNGRPTPVDRPFAARFDRRTLSLRLGCEWLSAPYVLAGQLLSAGAVTKNAAPCPDPSFQEAAERTLSLPLSVEAIGTEQLILRNALGTLSLARERR